MRNVQGNVEFGHQLSICSGTKENLDHIPARVARGISGLCTQGTPSKKYRYLTQLLSLFVMRREY
jgi:hypothetical protein